MRPFGLPIVKTLVHNDTKINYAIKLCSATLWFHGPRTRNTNESTTITVSVLWFPEAGGSDVDYPWMAVWMCGAGKTTSTT